MIIVYLSLSLCHYVSTYQFSVFFLSASLLSIGPLIRVSFLWMMLESALCKTDSSVSSSLSLSLWNVYLARQRLSYYIVLSNLYSYTCFYLDHAFILLFFFPCFESDNIVWKSCLDKIWQKFVGSLATKRKLPTQLRICRSYTSFSQELIWFELQKLGFKASTSSGFDQHWWEMDRTGKFSKQHVVFTGNSSVNLWWDLILGQVFSTCFPGRP